ncbi:choline dehydrogenase, mitochondrial-like isoform X1 [Petromyzon marinus]|uniref:choline dehydrogenase, mitochondrial-like isoform X1 n=2 Tax=Petromyzon marinus TaxID=7757 RepID=UPI003F6EA7BF
MIHRGRLPSGCATLPLLLSLRHWGSVRGGPLLPRSLAPLPARRLHSAGGPLGSDGGGSHYSHVVVGAGSAGCVMAGRLSEDAASRVLLLEAGPRDTVLGSKRLAWHIHMPAGLSKVLHNSKYAVHYYTEPQEHLGGRSLLWPRGRVWGGTSSMNGMIYIRGHALDYDGWEQEHGASGWSYANCLPYFRRAQSHALGPDEYRGGDGPLRVSRVPTQSPLHVAFLEAASQAGHALNEDMNGFRQEGFGWYDLTIHQGKRWSSACAYLHPALSRPNLEVRDGAVATRVLFRGERAVGVEVLRGGVKEQVFAEREVILCGGAINSPQLLLLSGIGPEKHLKQVGIPVLVNSPGVGRNLQDHLNVSIKQRCAQPLTAYTAQKPHNMIRTGLAWMLTSTGPAVTAHIDTGGFVRSEPGVRHPDLQFHFIPGEVINHFQENSTMEAFQVSVCALRPQSRGWVELKSTNPLDAPLIQPNYLSTDRDVWEMRRCVEVARDVVSQRAFGPYRSGEVAPGPGVKTAAEVDAWVRTQAETTYHPCGTCRMGGREDAAAVVDEFARVRGVSGLRVVDASVFPSVPSGNTNAPTIMVAERVADLVRGRETLPPSHVPVYVAGDDRQ